jgi:hypothetical protein
MIIYVDRLTFRSCMRVLRILRGRKGREEKASVRVLDPMPGGIRFKILALGFALLGIELEEVSFFAGHLKNPGGESIYTVALTLGNRLAWDIAKKTLERSTFLSRLNARWGRSVVELQIAKSSWMRTFHFVLHLLVADALAREEKDAELHHVVDTPPMIDPRWGDWFQGLRAHLHFSTCLTVRDNPFYALYWYLSRRAWGVWCRSRSGVRSRTGGSSPALLLMQEDELSLDRSHRAQPHWFFSEDGKTPFETVIVQSPLFEKVEIDREKLASEGITLLSLDEFYASGISAPCPLRKRVRKDMRSLVLRSFMGGATGSACRETAILFYYADLFAALSAAHGVRAFMTCENYMAQADAVQLIAPESGIRTLSYQYSNMSEVGPLMMTAADAMFSFSPIYHERWEHEGIGPKEFVDTGYLFDRSFAGIRSRANARREKLRESGCELVVCYLDESVQDGKYGLIHKNDHLGEIRTLIGYMLDIPSIGLVVKTQFKRNSPQALDGSGELYARAAGSGRYLELSHGRHRNNVFPAEAAMSSDIVIGHAIGATAALEAALTGARCILLNPYGFKGANDPIYRKADILYPSLESALEAIEAYRNSDPERERLGDWSPIIDLFDPFRDGRSSARLRDYIEDLFKENETVPGGQVFYSSACQTR